MRRSGRRLQTHPTVPKNKLAINISRKQTQKSSNLKERSISPQRLPGAGQVTREAEHQSHVTRLRSDTPETSSITYARFKNKDHSVSPSRRKVKPQLKSEHNKNLVISSNKSSKSLSLPQQGKKEPVKSKSSKTFSNLKEKFKHESSLSKQKSSKDTPESVLKRIQHSSFSGKAVNKNVNLKTDASVAEISKPTKSANTKSTPAKTPSKEKQSSFLSRNKITTTLSNKAAVPHKLNNYATLPREGKYNATKKEVATKKSQKPVEATKQDSAIEDKENPTEVTPTPSSTDNSSVVEEKLRDNCQQPKNEREGTYVWEDHAQTLPKDFVISPWAKFEDIDWSEIHGIMTTETPVVSDCQNVSKQSNATEKENETSNVIGGRVNSGYYDKDDILNTPKTGTINSDTGITCTEVTFKDAHTDLKTEQKISVSDASEGTTSDGTRETNDHQLDFENEKDDDENCKPKEFSSDIIQTEDRNFPQQSTDIADKAEGKKIQDKQSSSTCTTNVQSIEESKINVLPLPPRKLREAMKTWVCFEEASHRVNRTTQQGEDSVVELCSSNWNKKEMDNDNIYENVWFGSESDPDAPFHDDECDEEFKVYASVKPFGDEDISSSFDTEDDPFAKATEEPVYKVLFDNESSNSDPSTAVDWETVLVTRGPPEEVVQKPMRFDRIFKLDVPVSDYQNAKSLWQDLEYRTVGTSSVVCNQCEGCEIIPVLEHNFEYALCRFEVDYKGIAHFYSKKIKLCHFSAPLPENYEKYPQLWVCELSPVEYPLLCPQYMTEPIPETFLASHFSMVAFQNTGLPALINVDVEEVEADLVDKCDVQETSVSTCTSVDVTNFFCQELPIKNGPSSSSESRQLIENDELNSFDSQLLHHQTVEVVNSDSNVCSENSRTFGECTEEAEAISIDEVATVLSLVTAENSTTQNLSQERSSEHVDNITVKNIAQEDISSFESNHVHSFAPLKKDVQYGEKGEASCVDVSDESEKALRLQFGEKGEISNVSLSNDDFEKYHMDISEQNMSPTIEDVKSTHDFMIMYALESLEEIKLEHVSQEAVTDPFINSCVTFMDPLLVASSTSPMLVSYDEGMDSPARKSRNSEDDELSKLDVSKLDIPEILVHAPSEEVLTETDDNFLMEDLKISHEYDCPNNDNDQLEALENNDEFYCSSDMEDIPVCSLAEEEMLRALMYASAEEATQEFIDVFVMSNNHSQLPERVQAKAKKIEKHPLMLPVVKEEITYSFTDCDYGSSDENHSLDDETGEAANEDSKKLDVFCQGKEIFPTEVTEANQFVFTAAINVLSLDPSEIEYDLEALDIPSEVFAEENYEPETLKYADYENCNLYDIHAQPLNTLQSPHVHEPDAQPDTEESVIDQLGKTMMQEFFEITSSEKSLIQARDVLHSKNTEGEGCMNIKAENYGIASSCETSTFKDSCPSSGYLLSNINKETPEHSSVDIGQLIVQVVDANDQPLSDSSPTNLSGFLRCSAPLQTSQPATSSLYSRAGSVESRCSSLGGDVISISNAAVLQYWAGVMRERRNYGSFGGIADFPLPEEKGIKTTASIPIPAGGFHTKDSKDITNLFKVDNDLEESFVYFLSCTPDSVFDGDDFQLPVEEEEDDWLQELEDIKEEEEAFDSEFGFGELELDLDDAGHPWGKLSPKAEDRKQYQGKMLKSDTRRKRHASPVENLCETELRQVENDVPNQGGWMDGLKHTTQGLYNLFFYGQTPGVQTAEQNAVTEVLAVSEGKKMTDDDIQHVDSQALNNKVEVHASHEKHQDDMSELSSHTVSGGARTKTTSYSVTTSISSCAIEDDKKLQSACDESGKLADFLPAKVATKTNTSRLHSATSSTWTASQEERNALFMAQVAGISLLEESNRAALHLLLTQVLKLCCFKCVLSLLLLYLTIFGIEVD